MIPDDFFDSLQQIPGLDPEAFREAMQSAPAVSVKLNRRKLSDARDLGYGELEKVGWCASGYYLPERPIFTLNPLLHAGAFYVQDASSMIYESIVAEIRDNYGLSSDSAVLDLCAAPGGKSTSIINALPDGALLVANEFMPQRARILVENLLKWGYPDIMVTNSDTSRFASAGELFDLVAVDAPCSGEGMMRKDEQAVEQWSRRLVEKCASLQRGILANAVAALSPGGFLIYSTCTFNTTEDEENARWLRDEFGMEPLSLPIFSNPMIGKGCDPEIPALRFMPHITRGEGLFVTAFRKPGSSAPLSRRKLCETLRKKTRVILDGIPSVTIKGKVEIPASEWCLATDFPAGSYPRCEVGESTALSYLRHETITLPTNMERGFVVITYKGHPLGFVKNIGSRANNLYPASWKIRMK